MGWEDDFFFIIFGRKFLLRAVFDRLVWIIIFYHVKFLQFSSVLCQFMMYNSVVLTVDYFYMWFALVS